MGYEKDDPLSKDIGKTPQPLSEQAAIYENPHHPHSFNSANRLQRHTAD